MCSVRHLLNVAVAVVTVGMACGGGPSGPSPLASGRWGGDHVVMTVASTATHLEFDCAHGDIPGTVLLDRNSRFAATGTFVREHGGPIREGEPADSHPANYTGSVAGDRMTLNVRVIDTDLDVGTFTLTRGATGSIVKCL